MRNKELREAIIAALKAHAPFATLLAADPLDATPAVYSHVPQTTGFPYLIVTPARGVDHDTDTTLGWDAELVIDSWSRFRGQDEIEELQRETDDAINRTEPSITDARVVTLHRTECDNFLDKDGLTRHGIHRFRVILEEL